MLHIMVLPYLTSLEPTDGHVGCVRVFARTSLHMYKPLCACVINYSISGGAGQAMPSSREEGQHTKLGTQALAGHLFGKGRPRAGLLSQKPFTTPLAKLPECGEPHTFALQGGSQGQEVGGEETKSRFPDMVPDDGKQPAPWEIQGLSERRQERPSEEGVTAWRAARSLLSWGAWRACSGLSR